MKSNLKYGIFNVMAFVLGALNFATDGPTGGGGGTQTGTAAAQQEQDTFTQWWNEISGGERALKAGLYDVMPETNPFYIGKAGNEGLAEAQEFIANNPGYVCSLDAAEGTYIILSERPTEFEGEIHGNTSGLLFLDQVGDAVLIVPEPAKTA